MKGEDFWRDFLERGGDTWQGVGRRILKRIPSDPRCRMCGSPFHGPGAPVMRLFGKRPSASNPNWCTTCFDFMAKHHGGAEIDGAMLFADIRGSTALAESMSSSEYHALLDRYFVAATAAVFKYDGFVDKFVGDELVALFFPLLTGERYVVRAVGAAQELLRHLGPGKLLQYGICRANSGDLAIAYGQGHIFELGPVGIAGHHGSMCEYDRATCRGSAPSKPGR